MCHNGLQIGSRNWSQGMVGSSWKVLAKIGKVISWVYKNQQDQSQNVYYNLWSKTLLKWVISMSNCHKQHKTLMKIDNIKKELLLNS